MNKAKAKRYGLILLAVVALGLSQMACDDTDTSVVTTPQPTAIAVGDTDATEMVDDVRTADNDGSTLDTIIAVFDAVDDAVCTDGDTRAMCNGGVEIEAESIDNE